MVKISTLGERCAKCRGWTRAARGGVCSACKARLGWKKCEVLCPRCQGPRFAQFPTCRKCYDELHPTSCEECGLRIKVGLKCPRWYHHEIEKIWQSPEWKRRRDDVVARARVCEARSCGRAFSARDPAHVNHLRNYVNADGWTADWAAYLKMRSDEVEVICRTCHWLWTKYKKYGGDPEVTCPKCRGLKNPKRATCFRCWGGKERLREIKAFRDLAREAERSLEAACEKSCHHGCERVDLVLVDYDGEPQLAGPNPVECVARELLDKYPGHIRLHEDVDREMEQMASGEMKAIE